MFDRLPCKPRPTSYRPLVEWIALCSATSYVLHYFGA